MFYTRKLIFMVHIQVRYSTRNERGIEMQKLAILGGSPIREKPIYYGKQYIDEDDIMAVVETLKQPLITSGPKIDEVEEKICEITGAKYAVVVANGTAALHIACMSLGIGEGDEVITTPLTFVASANSILYCGAKVVFADVNPYTYNICVEDIKRKITSRTKAIIAVDFTGQAAELDKIREICKQNNLYFIEDAAHAIGTRYDGAAVGSIADVTCFSFHPVKTVTSGEGGAVTTNDIDIYRKLKLLTGHGITRDQEMMIEEPHGSWYYEQIALGFNYRMTDFQAALLISQLNKLSEFSSKRKQIIQCYNNAFKDIDEIILQKNHPKSDTTPHLYIIQLDLDKLNCTRKEFFDAMKAEGINCQIHYIPVYYHPYYSKLGYKKGICSNAEKIYERIMSIPLYYEMKDEDINDVVDAVKKIVEWYRK